MATPILSKPQQRKSLSVKKTPIKGLKNVLGQPCDNYWPYLHNDRNNELENHLKSLLPILSKPAKTKIPWNKLRQMTKDERIAAKSTESLKINDNIDDKPSVDNKSIIFGINSITRSLEKNEICCILLDANVDPLILIKHIVTMARDKCIPTVMISSLKKLTLKIIGFTSVAIALKKCVQESSENYFYSLFNKVSEMSNELRSLEPPICTIEEKFLLCDELKEQKISENTSEKKDIIVSTDVYLYRESKKIRSFIPPTLCENNQKNQLLDSDYIPLGNDKYFIDAKKVPSRFFHEATYKNENIDNCINKVSHKVGTKTTSKVNYKPLRIKRLQGNEFRTKATKQPKLKKTDV